jgi:hypothetical protein
MNDTVVLNRDKVYTSYYARACRVLPDWRIVAISIGIPDNFGGEIMRELNPPSQLLYDYKNGLCSNEEYKQRYTDGVLAYLNPYDVYNKVKGKALLCYCGKDRFCHRHIVLEWLSENIGEHIIGGEV